MASLLSFGHTFLAFVIVLTVIVFIHEFGHYLVARLCGVRIVTFSIGFGRELFGWSDKHGTRWKVCVLPLGGYVKMFGDASAASNADVDVLANLSETEKRETFHFKPLHQKAMVVAAGPLANFILTIAVLTFMIFTVGLQSTEPVVGEIMPDTPAAAAHLKAGDRILSVNGKTMKRFNDIPLTLATNVGAPVALEIERGEQHLSLTITPKQVEDDDGLGNKITRPIIGIKSPTLTYKDVTLPHALWEATERTYAICQTTLVSVGQIITGERGTKELKGPLGIAKLSGQAADKGTYVLLWLIAMLSANLGLVNLFPIPLLDGGHLAFYTAEALRGRPMAERVQEWGYRLGFSLIAMLMALSLYNDVKQIFLG